MTEIQAKILPLLMEIDTICRENDIEYYLEGGAILGAIRHGGFLPWDDDSDLVMTRSNWEKFKKVFFRDKPQNRALESPELNDLYPTNTMRYIDTTTTSIWRSTMYDVCACGIFVDIFILEDAPDDDEKLEQMKRDFIDYCEIINPYYRLSSLGDGKRFRALLKKSRRIGRKKVAKELDEKILQYHGMPSKRYLMRWGMRFQVYDKAVYGKPTYVPFEDVMLPIPERPLDYLVYQYGIDWFMIPEAEDMERHDTVLDLDIGYRTYIDDYMPLIDRKKALAVNYQYKISDMEILDYNKAYHRHMYQTAGNAAAILLKKKLQGVDLDMAFSEVSPEADEKFEQLFGDYLTKQLFRWYLFYGVYVPIDDDTLACILSYLLRSGRCREAEKLLNIRLDQKKPLSAKLKTVQFSYQILVDSGKLFWSGRRKEAAELIKASNVSDIAPIETAFCLFDEVLGIDADELESLREKTERLIQRWPQEDLFRLTYLLILERLGAEKSSLTAAKELMGSSKNGMVLRILQTDALFSQLRCRLTEK